MTDANANAGVQQTEVPEATDANAIANAGVQQPEVQQGKVTETKKEEQEDPIKLALLEQLKQIEEKTNEIKSKLAAAVGGGLNKISKKRKKTFYKKYKSKMSVKRRNKTSRNN